MKFRDLRADEIDVRIAMCKEKGCSLLLYKDARCDMNILDETVGAENWEREHYECKGNLFCRLGIKCGDEWIYKSDCGKESNTEAEKGEASDSFKRAAFNWGLGRELYTSPFIWVMNDKCKIYDTGRKDKYNKPVFACSDKFVVEKIIIQNKKIVALSIFNETQGKRAFIYQDKNWKAEDKTNE